MGELNVGAANALAAHSTVVAPVSHLLKLRRGDVAVAVEVARDEEGARVHP